jgi:hypothetical protein
MTTMMQRPNLHDLVKEAMEGTARKVDISAEAMRQLADVGADPEEKTASVKQPDHVPTEYIHKLADALDFMVKKAGEGTTSIQPGKGPNALAVLEATSEDKPIQPGGQGHARTQIPTSPPMASSGVAKDPPNAMATNIDMKHREQPTHPMGKSASAEDLYARNLIALGLTPTVKVASSEDDLLARNRAALGLEKKAEDAINPAQISAGKVSPGLPEGAGASGESVPAEPGDVSSQKRLISSNEAAMSYTKGEAKADPKSDVAKVLVEPPLSAATDKTLSESFDNTSKAGVKIAADLTRSSAAQALLSKLAEDAEAEAKKSKKEKTSNAAMGYGGGGGLATPSGQSGFTATSV